MFFEDLNWMDVESYLAQDDRLIFITGATEQHAYLSLLTDIRIPKLLAAAVAQRTNVLVAPPLNFGVSPYFMEYPGTISLTQATFDLVVTEIITGLVGHGFKRILMLNGHGGNQFPSGVQQLVEAGKVQVKWHNWWQSEVAKAFIAEVGKVGTHANWMENFPFTRVAESPSGEKAFVDSSAVSNGKVGRAELGDGSYGGVYEMPDEVMSGFFDRVVREITEMIEQW